MKKLSRIAAIITLAAGLAAPAVHASSEEAETHCTFAGVTPGYRVMQLDLPQGSDFLVLRLVETRDIRPVNDETTWHLAQGILILDEAREVVAHQIFYAGTAAPKVVLEADGQTLARQSVVAPEGPWIHSTRKGRDDLPPGSYLVVAFGTGGPYAPGTQPPQQWWGASIDVRGAHSCLSIAPGGETFDYDHTDFEGGTQLYLPGVGVAEEIGFSFATERSLVVGLMDSAVQAAEVGSVSLSYEMPAPLGGETVAGEIGRALVPFVSSAGELSFEASYRGLYPIIGIAGAAFDLPGEVSR